MYRISIVEIGGRFELYSAPNASLASMMSHRMPLAVVQLLGLESSIASFFWKQHLGFDGDILFAI